MRALIEPVERRTLLAGVTILTHGYNGSITGWVKTAADDIAQRIGEDTTARYVMTVALNSKRKLAVTFFTHDGGPTLEQSPTSEAIVRLDWTAVDDATYSTADVGAVVSDYLMSSHGSERPLAGFALHLIGHSRGASLMSDVAHRLGEHGVWVDQATYLDPHPVDGGADDFFLDLNDPQVEAWDNTTFVDNYWRTDNSINLDPDGEPVDGSHESDLNSTVQANFVGSAHLSVPAYYIGTIDTSTLDGGDTVIEPSWYTGTNPRRTATGYALSRLGGSARPADGLRAEFGGTAARKDSGESGTQWANVSDLQVLSGTTYTIGEPIPLRIKQQDRGGDHTITLWIDRDRDPYNDNNIRKIRSINYGETAELSATRINGSTSGIEPGTYYVYARVTDARDHARYTYSRRITLVAPAGSVRAQVFSSAPVIHDPPAIRRLVSQYDLV